MAKKKKQEQEGEIVEVVPVQAQEQNTAISELKNEADLKEAELKHLQEFVASHMQDGQDYGVIQSVDKRTGEIRKISEKPTLFKPGAEKLFNFFNFSTETVEKQKILDVDKNFFYIEYEVRVTDRNGRFITNGIGSANSKESKFAYDKNVWNQVNTITKMADKRAFVAAALKATRASHIFTQDIEDISANKEASSPATAPQNSVSKNVNQSQNNIAPTKTVLDEMCPQCRVNFLVRIEGDKQYEKDGVTKTRHYNFKACPDKECGWKSF